jgi:uncharacterized protein YjbJ (UPF0337 family)
MISFQQIRKIFLNISLTIFIATSITFGFATASSWANSQVTPSQSNIATMKIASIFSRNIEGKAQELKGNITGDSQDQIMGKAKQVESQAAENMKSNLEIPGRIKAASKQIEGKAQEFRGNLTGSTQDQIMGKSKQVESQARNALEDIKDGVQDILH